MRKLVLLATVAVLAAIPASGANAQSGDASVTVVHGVPGLTVDVYVNDELTLEDFKTGTITDPLSLPAGDYTIDVREAGAEASADPAITADATLESGSNVSIVAHLNGNGDPALTPFVNDASSVGGGEARVSVRHTAAAPAVDVLAGGDPIVEGLENPNEETITTAAATVPVAVAPAGETDPVLGPTDLELAPGASYAVYAIGSLEDDNLDLLVQQLGGAGAAVPAGDSGLVADAGGLPTGVLLALGLLGAAVLIGSATVLARGRARA
jgi:hypothetical protein